MKLALMACIWMTTVKRLKLNAKDEDEQQTTDPCATPKRRGKGKAKSKRGPTTKKRRLTLNKEEKARVLLSIHDVTVENVVLHVDKTLTNARHILDNKARTRFMEVIA